MHKIIQSRLFVGYSWNYKHHGRAPCPIEYDQILIHSDDAQILPRCVCHSLRSSIPNRIYYVGKTELAQVHAVRLHPYSCQSGAWPGYPASVCGPPVKWTSHLFCHKQKFGCDPAWISHSPLTISTRYGIISTLMNFSKHLVFSM